jgi:4-hydroxybenzoate polyprenyltransferase
MKIEIDCLTYNILLVMIMSLCAYFISPWCFLMVFCGAYRGKQEK